MMAGISAKNSENKVCILEKNRSLGKKLLLTGKGRCNLTTSKEIPEIIDAFGKKGKFLYGALTRFSNQHLMLFFEKRGVKLKVERGSRVFPESDKALTILNCLRNELKKKDVKIYFNFDVAKVRINKSFALLKTFTFEESPSTSPIRPRAHGREVRATSEEAKVQNLKIKNHLFKVIGGSQAILAKKLIIATGGKSYPQTGSTGDGYRLAKKLGHTIIPLSPALSALIVNNKKVRSLAGLSLKNVKLTVLSNKKKVGAMLGEMLFTHSGISGPIVLAMSKLIFAELQKKNKIEVSIDLKPGLDVEPHGQSPWLQSTAGGTRRSLTPLRLKATRGLPFSPPSTGRTHGFRRRRVKSLRKRIQREMELIGKKEYHSLLKKLLPNSLICLAIELTAVDRNKKVGSLTRGEQKRLLTFLKGFSFKIDRVAPIETAMVTSGGVNIKEIDPKSMQSKIVPNLFFAGEIISLDGPTGGYNLQKAFSSGWVAGKFAGENQACFSSR